MIIILDFGDLESQFLNPGAGPRGRSPCPCLRPSVVTEGYRGSPPCCRLPPAETGEPGRNLGGTRGEPSVAWGFGFFCDIFVFDCVFDRFLAFLLACWANIASSRANIAPRWLNLVPRWANIALRRAKIAPRWANIAPTWTNIASKLVQHSLNMGAKTLRIHGFFNSFCISSFFGSTSGQDWTTYV